MELVTHRVHAEPDGEGGVVVPCQGRERGCGYEEMR